MNTTKTSFVFGILGIISLFFPIIVDLAFEYKILGVIGGAALLILAVIIGFCMGDIKIDQSPQKEVQE